MLEKVLKNKECENCKKNFEITDVDENFYKTIKVPEPTWCPDCRQQRRLIWRNERTLYKRKCSATGQEIISVYSEDKPFPVYNNDYWYSDKWNALDYGQQFDFNRPFFDQFQELMNKVPQLSRSTVNCQNSDYINQAGWCKNCYLIYEGDYNENCMYSNYITDSRFCLDMLMVNKCELCYECVDCDDSYNLKFSQNCKNCSDSWFLKNCIGCRNCFGCSNLSSKEYYFLNKKYSKEEYLKKVESVNLKTYKALESARNNFLEFIKNYPQKYLLGVQNEDSVGNYLSYTQRCNYCFDVNHSQDCKYVSNCRYMKMCHDIAVFGSQQGCEFCYEDHEIGAAVRNVLFSDQVWDSCYDIYYSKLCMKNCHHLFGCVGLKHQEYCILNKKYSPEEYEKLKDKIIEHMKKPSAPREGGASGSSGPHEAELIKPEYGQFFPAKLCPYGYNETVAMYYFPLTKEQALAKNYAWKDPDKKEYKKQTCKIPEQIQEVPDSIVNEVLACEKCGKNYKIIEAELDFYRRQKLPIPNYCSDCRHKTRFSFRNPRKLYKRNCQKCNLEIQTTFDPKGPEIVYCEKCYLQSLS